MKNIVSVKRESSIELLRVISMLLIICHHFVCFRYKSFGSLGLVTLNNFMMSFFWNGGKYGVVLFSLITGYFMINSKVSLKKIIKLELQILFYTISIMLLFVILKGRVVTEREIELFFSPALEKTYWFYTSYLMLNLFIPIINFILLKLNKKQFIVLLGILFCLFVGVPTMFIHLNFFKEGIYLFFYYIVGAFIRLYMDNRKEKKLFLVGGIVFYLFIIFSTFGVQYLSKFNSILLGNMYYFTKISSALVFMSAVCLFMFFKNIKLKESKFINWLGSVSFGVYLFHEHPYMRNFLWFELFDVNLYTNTIFFGVKGICIVCAIFIVGGLYETVRQFLFKLISNMYLKGKKYLLSTDVD